MKQSEPKKYRVFFHCGEELGLKTKVQKGRAWLDNEGLHVEGPAGSLLVVSKSNLVGVELFRLHGTCTVIRVDHEAGRLFLSVIRFLIGGQLMLVNYFGTLELHQKLSALVAC